ERIGDSVHVTDLITIVSRNRPFANTQSRLMKLDQDVSIEVPLVRVLTKGNLLQCRTTIQPISRVEFRETHPCNPVFQPRENLVADEFVFRHSACEWIATIGHAGAKHHVSLISFERREQFRQYFGRILSIGVKHHDDVEPTGDCIFVSGFLVSTVAKVFRVSVNGELLDRLGVFVSDRGVIGVIGRAIVEEEYLVDLVPDLLRNAIERPIEFVYGVVGNDENADALLAHETPLQTRYTFSWQI